jgi:hypothetical protein
MQKGEAMSDCMTFPDTVEEFMEQYKVVDTGGIYMSKGVELVPIFRMSQWFEHLPFAQSSGICYIQEALDVLEIYKRNMIHILGDQDEKVKVIETCQMLISELEENKDK